MLTSKQWFQIVSGVISGLITGAAFMQTLFGQSVTLQIIAGLGLLVAGVLRAEATLAAANLVYLLLLAGGAVVLPSSSYGAFGHVTPFLPSGALGDALRHSLIDGTTAWRDLVVLLVWAVAGTALTARTFRWE